VVIVVFAVLQALSEGVAFDGPWHLDRTDQPAPVATPVAHRELPLLVRVTVSTVKVTLAVSLASVLLLLLVRPLLGVGVSPVLTGSMRPTYGPGDVILTRTVPTSTLHAGMIAVITPPGESKAFAHRLVSVTGDPTRPFVRTRGDANPTVDSWKVQLAAPSTTVVIGSLPHLGSVMLLAGGPLGRSFGLALLELLATGYAIRVVLRPRPVRVLALS
jgi:signal peptidase